MSARWLAGLTVAVLAAAFAALSLSVVDARRDVDRHVAGSFAATVGRVRPVTAPQGCRKRALDFYDCAALVRYRGVTRVDYRLALTDDGCWTATPAGRLPRALRLAAIRGCVADAPG